MTPKASYADRFWSKVDVADKDSCWLWQASVDCWGYGRFWLNGKNRGAYRISWSLSFGSISPGICVLYKCDTPACVNPSHLFLGSHKDNVADCVSKNRRWLAKGDRHWSRKHPEKRLRGELNGFSKLTNKVVSVIRDEYSKGRSQQSMALEYKVSQRTISRVVRSETWRHV